MMTIGAPIWPDPVKIADEISTADEKPTTMQISDMLMVKFPESSEDEVGHGIPWSSEMKSLYVKFLTGHYDKQICDWSNGNIAHDASAIGTSIVASEVTNCKLCHCIFSLSLSM